MPEPSGSRKRKRPITACVECYRRKQKCDRKEPCQICVARNVPCLYLDPSEEPATKQSRSNSAGEDEDLIATARKDSRPSDLSFQIGYSDDKGSNTLDSVESWGPNEEIAAGRPAPVVSYLKDRFSTILRTLPQAAAETELIGVFFADANSQIGIISHYFFNRTLSTWNQIRPNLSKSRTLEVIRRELLYFPALLFQMLAVALQYVDLDSTTVRLLQLDSYDAVDSLAQKYSLRGMEIMKLLGRHNPTLMSVEHDLLRCFWLKNSSNATEAWYILGDAIRQAQGLGLHLESNASNLTGTARSNEAMWQDQLAKRLWIHLFNWDAHTALMMGRPRTINESDCTVHPPINCNMPEHPLTTPLDDPILQQTPSGYTRHLFNNFIARKTHEALALGTNRRHVGDYGVVMRLHEEVLRGLADLPPASNPLNPDTSWDTTYTWLPKLRQIMLTFAHSFLIALHRPHVATHVQSRNAAISSALETLAAQKRLYEHLPSSQFRTFGMSFYTIDAGLVLSTTVLEFAIENHGLLGHILSSLSDAIERLNVIKGRSPMADSGVKVLERCYVRLLEKYSHANELRDVPPEALGLQAHPATPTPATLRTLPAFAYPDVPGAPNYAHMPWNYPQSEDNSATDQDLLIGNLTDFSASMWTDQMSSILDSSTNQGANSNSTWLWPWS